MVPEPEYRLAGGVSYTLTRRRVKNLNMRVRPDGSVAVSAPRRASAREVDAFVAARAAWVEDARHRVLARRAAEEAVPLPTKQQALAMATALCNRYYPEFAAICPNGAMPHIRVRDMTTRWGTCSLHTGTLTFSLRLFTKSAAAQEYVVVHEFSHFAVANHSPAFWAVVAAHMPDYAQRRKLLRAPR